MYLVSLWNPSISSFLPFIGFLRNIWVVYDKASDYIPPGILGSKSDNSSVFSEDNNSGDKHKCKNCGGTGMVEEDNSSLDIAVFGGTIGVFSGKVQCPVCGGTGES